MRVAIGAITRRRPKMFGELLDSFAAMQRPEGVEVIFLFAENDEAHQAAEVVEAFRKRVPEPVQLGLEPRQGIPMGRNKVLDMALEEGVDFLTFVDDDEVVAADWLVTLMEGVTARGLELAGGPVRLVAPAGTLTGWNRAVLKHLQKRAEGRIRSKSRRAEGGRDGAIDIYTNNWCLSLDAQRRTGVRFDEALQFTGGSDTKFSRDFLAAGGRIGFVPAAYVDDPMPQKRLTLGYHFKRARDQSNNAVVLGQKSKLSCIGQAFLRLLDGLLNFLTVPLTGRYGVVKAVHKLGIAAGRLRGAFGARSSHYGTESAQFHTEKRG
ncbi:glycosyltransferase [Aliiruegeria lutimaris]|uniref:Glycosyltransferase, GT2 family n=1 Tax=Aliiruegeria lutimaris TaxID=571298 RepID=A0A1G8LF88_9RHOB|nr:glycosyltransferase family A protein [Aliiruegeria lutimaris]SDI54305.1 Glycosyltransferase, GT2 family [Aliiruegeria lutimaris]